MSQITQCLRSVGQCFLYLARNQNEVLHLSHSSYFSQPAVVYFFLAGVLFSIENTKCWPNLANFDQFWLFCREFTEFFGVLFIDLNNAAVY